MSVASKNPFALLGDDDSSSAPAPAPAAAPAATPASTTRGGARGRGGGPARGGGYYRRGGGGNKSAPREGGDAAEEPAAGDEGRRKFGEGRGGRGGREGRGRGRGRGRGGRGGAGGRLDRHSATGITDSDKKIHQGWGGDEPGTELNAEVGGAADAAKEGGEVDDWGVSPDSVPAAGEGAAPTAEGEGAGADRRREEEEEDNTLTLEQYRQQQIKSDIVPGKLEGRKVDDTEIKGDVIRKGTEEEESYFAGKSKSAPKARTEKKEKVFIEIDARFERPQRGGRGRGGFERGRGRGEGRGRGDNRGRGRGGRQNGAQSGPQIDDESAFPALG